MRLFDQAFQGRGGVCTEQGVSSGVGAPTQCIVVTHRRVLAPLAARGVLEGQEADHALAAMRQLLPLAIPADDVIVELHLVHAAARPCFARRLFQQVDTPMSGTGAH